MASDRPSKSSVKRAGSTLRAASRGECTREELERALEVVVAYRACFSEPMASVLGRLTDLAGTLSAEVEITNRLKRLPTIVEKLTERESGLDLSRMHDIGGCRVVVSSYESLPEVRAAIDATWPGSKVLDYYERPRGSGYRAVHIIVTELGLPIEVQLRSPSAHAWAETVESFSAALGTNFKQDGTHPVQRFLEALALVLHADEAGLGRPVDAIATMDRLRPSVSEALRALTEPQEDGKG